jgi:hypothetical protein
MLSAIIGDNWRQGLATRFMTVGSIVHLYTLTPNGIQNMRKLS